MEISPPLPKLTSRFSQSTTYTNFTTTTPSPITTSTKLQNHAPSTKRHPPLLCALRIFQGLTVLITLSIYTSYLVKLQPNYSMSESNEIALIIIACSFPYAIFTLVAVFFVPYGKYVISLVMTVMDWVVVVGYVAVAVLVRPVGRCRVRGGGVEKRGEIYYGVDRDGDDDDGDDDRNGAGGDADEEMGSVKPTATHSRTRSTQSTTSCTSTATSAKIPAHSTIERASRFSSVSLEIQTTLIMETSTSSLSPALQTPIASATPTSPTSDSTPTSTVTNGISLSETQSIRFEVGISSGDCNLAMVVFVLAMITVILYFTSIFAPCAFPPRKEVVGVVVEKGAERDANGDSDDHVHNTIDEYLLPRARISGRWAIV